MTETNTPHQLPTIAELHEQLMHDVNRRRVETTEEIAQAERDIQRLRSDARQLAESQSGYAAGLKLNEIPGKDAVIAAARLRLRALDDEAEEIISGKHLRLQGSAHHYGRISHATTQAEYREASQAFHALISPELKTAAARLLEATKAMGFEFIPSPIAVAIAQRN